MNHAAAHISGTNVRELSDFDEHELIINLHDYHPGLHGFIAIHRGGKDVPAFGATRIWPYESEDEALRDALRLSRGMSYKSALAGLPYGGAKGVIIGHASDQKEKREFLKIYADAVNSLKGNFITGTDVGLSHDDVIFLRELSPYFVGVSVDPIAYTAQGISLSIDTCQEQFLKNLPRTIAIQGVGKIGEGLLSLIYDTFDSIWITDSDPFRVKEVATRFPKVHISTPENIHCEEASIFAPCALGGILNTKTVRQLKARAVIGGANNQLEYDSVGDMLLTRKIIYAPDYVVNAGGLISVVSEYEHESNNHEKIMQDVHEIPERVVAILHKSIETGIASNRIADEMAEEIFNRI